MAAIQHENFAKRSQFNAIHPPGRIGQAGLDSSGTSGTCNFHPRQVSAPDSIPGDPIESIESIALYHPVRHGHVMDSREVVGANDAASAPEPDHNEPAPPERGTYVGRPPTAPIQARHSDLASQRGRQGQVVVAGKV
ncbi:hypothetical protein HETIRDRAFT_455823 [Heterobasidion irregulare TC 32-1]|uniref:Uncharacterized protein n=1 Tax=Heterobasidion irregulare (strain TC 32-1) TaxID=747525 RepID=W4JNM0_HETIT|nr:uncharacterized protein HETIRDRAFT_455823 [Heterobasidion irregulare TC 32-1]ETW75138.1 hypothetical protein HETIRDRAFT_455823 [Heterobasidion irregulare TC 32-1]